MVIATSAPVGAAAEPPRPAAPPESAPRKADSLPTHTLRLASAPPRPPGVDGPAQPAVPVYDQGPYLQGPYLQLIAEQEIAPPDSAAPPPYPSNFPGVEPPAPPAQVTVVMPQRPRAIDIVGPASQTSMPSPAAGKSGGAGRWILVLVTLLALVAGFLAARYFVSRRSMQTVPTSRTDPSAHAAALPSASAAHVGPAPSASAASPAPSASAAPAAAPGGDP
jgi:hypothetical protein